MINRIFFISEKGFLPRDTLPQAENIFLSLLIDPADKHDLQRAYDFIAESAVLPVSLALNMREPLSDESLRFITSFLFLPSYLRVGYRQVVNFSGGSPELIIKARSALCGYLSVQGFDEIIMNTILTPEDQPDTKDNLLFDSSEKLMSYYKHIIQNGVQENRNIFFRVSSTDGIMKVMTLLQQAEKDFSQRSPQLYSLVIENKKLGKEVDYLKRKNTYTEIELGNQKQYGDILRSHHSTRELQDYYDNEYEILPKWYKRFGHLIKVIMGKRTFRSLFRDDVKKYNR